jgi:hypothetical protein
LADLPVDQLLNELESILTHATLGVVDHAAVRRVETITSRILAELGADDTAVKGVAKIRQRAKYLFGGLVLRAEVDDATKAREEVAKWLADDIDSLRSRTNQISSRRRR